MRSWGLGMRLACRRRTAYKLAELSGRAQRSDDMGVTSEK